MDAKQVEDGIVTRLQKWAAHPIKADMDLIDVALTTGFVVVLVFLWSRVVGLITEA